MGNLTYIGRGIAKGLEKATGTILQTTLAKQKLDMERERYKITDKYNKARADMAELQLTQAAEKAQNQQRMYGMMGKVMEAYSAGRNTGATQEAPVDATEVFPGFTPRVNINASGEPSMSLTPRTRKAPAGPNSATSKAMELIGNSIQNGQFRTAQDAKDYIAKNEEAFSMRGVDVGLISQKIDEIMPEKFIPGKGGFLGFGKTSAQRIKKGVLEVQDEKGLWKPKEVELPGTIKNTSEAVDFLTKNQGLSRDQAVEWLRAKMGR